MAVHTRVSKLDPIPIHRLILKRLADDRALLLSIFAGILIATTLVAAAPVYFRSLERLALDIALDGLDRARSNINVFGYNIPVTDDELNATQSAFDNAVDGHVAPILETYQRYLVVDSYLAGLPANPLPRSPEPLGESSRAYFRNLSNLYEHVTAVEGRLAESAVHEGGRGPVVEAVISATTASTFELFLNDEIELVSDIGAPARMTAVIKGIIEPIDAQEAYWEPSALSFLDPLEPEGGNIDYPVVFRTDEAPVPLFITREAMVEAIGRSYPGTLIDSLWFIRLDMEQLKGWSIGEFRQRFTGFEREIGRGMPGSEVFSGINSLLRSFEHKSFFSRVPMLLLMAIMVVTVLFYVSMMVAHLVRSREDDVALLRTRGGGTLQILRLYTLEGLAMVVIAAVAAPFLAMASVSLAGKLPYFRDMTGGDLLPAKVEPLPFLVAAGAGLLCLAIFVVPGIIGAKTGLLVQKLRSSRPPTSSLFHRYYIDVALVVVGGLTFWELYSRGQLVSGGLFKDVQVNETLLLAPIFFLLMIALVFMRLFPLLVRFVSGESAALLHLVTAATVAFVSGAVLVRSAEDGDVAASLAPSTLALAVGGAYWATSRARSVRLGIVGLALQGMLVAAFLAAEPLDPGEVLFAPSLFLVALVPAQMAFLLLEWFARVMPVWLSMALWHMARNPLQYTWLVLLLVLVTGLGILSTTVGGTLDKSHEDRIKYDVAADFRVTDVSLRLSGGVSSVRDGYLGIPGVNAASVAIRKLGSVGSIAFEVLGLEAREFAYMTWYRDDFSARPIGGIMQSLQPPIGTQKVAIPRGATTIGVSARPDVSYPSISVWMVIEDGTGDMTTVSLGKLEGEEWRTLATRIPPGLPGPLSLASVQLFEPGQGPVGTPGSVLLDDIYVTAGLADEKFLLDGFEGGNRWQRIVTSPLSSDRVSIVTDETGSNRAAHFTFGKETIEGVRGFYRSPTGGPVPVVVNASLFADANSRINDLLLINIEGLSIPVVIRDVVHQFPTMGRVPGRFMLADFEGLVAHLNMLSQERTYTPNELFISQAPAAHEVVRDGLKSWLGLTGKLHDRDTQLESARTDPLTTAGWESMVLASLGVVIVAAGLSYATYLLSFASGSRNEMGFLQSVGFSRRQLMGLLGFEHLSMALVGLGLGTWAGFQMSRMMVSSVAVTEKGQEIMPPYVLITDWSLMLPTYAALAAIFLASLYVLNRSVRRLDLNAIARGEGQ